MRLQDVQHNSPQPSVTAVLRVPERFRYLRPISDLDECCLHVYTRSEMCRIACDEACADTCGLR